MLAIKGKALIVLSGGMDSAVLLYKAIASGRITEVEAISFNYGQRHLKELEFAKRLCDEVGVRHDVVDISTIKPFIGGSALTDDITVPKGHYEDESMKATVVPNRNAIMLSISFGIAVARNANLVAGAMHSGDHAIYPDCRPEFACLFEAMQEQAIMGEPIRLWTPFINLDKTEIAEQGKVLKVPFHQTWSCYEGGDIHCGECGTCVERIEALTDAGADDQTAYLVKS